MYEMITTALTQCLTWFGTILDNMLGSTGLGKLMPVLVIAVAISLVMLTIKIVRKVCWGA